MAVFTPISTEILDKIRMSFELGDIVSRIGVAEGDNESTFLLVTKEQEWLATVFESPIDPYDLERAFQRMDLLREMGIPCPSTLRTRDGASSLLVGDKLIAIVGVVPGTQYSRIDSAKARDVGRTIARIHKILLGHMPVRWERRAGLVRGWLHGAIASDNLFFLDSRVSGIINFRLQHEGYLIEDLGQALADWGRHCDKHQAAIITELIRGYSDVRPLEARELESLPFFSTAALMTLNCISTSSDRLSISDISDVHAHVTSACITLAEGMLDVPGGSVDA